MKSNSFFCFTLLLLMLYNVTLAAKGDSLKKSMKSIKISVSNKMNAIKTWSKTSIRSRDAQYYHLTIIHFNDFHARFQETDEHGMPCDDPTVAIGGLPRVITVAKEKQNKAKHSLFVNLGDNYSGTDWHLLGRHELMVDALNVHPADAMVIGNHEFDHGLNGLLPYLKGISPKTPIILANADLKCYPEWQKYIQSSVVLERGPHKIGLIGVLDRYTNIHSNTENVTFSDEVETVKAEAKKLKKGKKATIIVVLSHCGLEMDRKIAYEAGEYVDIIVGGHSHSFMWTGDDPPGVETPVDDYPVMVTPKKYKQRKVLVIQASSYARFVGHLTVHFDKKGKIADWEGQPVYLANNIKPDEATLAALQKYKEKFDPISKNIITNVTTKLLADPEERFCGESLIGNLITDSFLKYHQNEWGKTEESRKLRKPQVALIHAMGISGVIREGVFTFGNLMSVLPFTNTVDAFDSTGEQLIAGIESCFTHHISFEPRFWSRRFVQVSGMKYTVNPRESAGKRISNVEIDGEGKIKLKSYYRIVTPHFLTRFFAGNSTTNITFGAIETDVVSNYLKSFPKFPMPVLSGRVTVIQEP